MKRFKFNLESVLTLRNWEEQRARSAFAKAQRDERLIADSLLAAETRIEADMNELRRGSDRALPAGERALRWRHLLDLESERTKLKSALMGARQICEKSRKVLIDAHRRVQVLEKLRSRKQQAHIAEVRRVEEREIEELVSARFQPGL